MKDAEKSIKFKAVTSTGLAKNPGVYVNAALYAKETTIITKQGVPAAALIPIEEITLTDADLEIIMSLLKNPPQPNATLTSAMQEFRSKHSG